MRRGGLFFLMLLELGLSTFAGATAVALVDIASVAGGLPYDPSHGLPSPSPSVVDLQRQAFALTFIGVCGMFVLVHLVIVLPQKLLGRATSLDAQPRSLRESLLNTLMAATFAVSFASATLQLALARGQPLRAAPLLLGWATTIVAFFALCFAWNGSAGWRRRALVTSGVVVACSALLSLAQASLAPALVTSLAATLHLAFDDIMGRARARQKAAPQ